MIRRAPVIGLIGLVSSASAASAVPPALSAAAAAPAARGGSRVEAVFTTITGHPSAAVPGDRTLAFRAGARNGGVDGEVGVGGVGRPAVSPDGRRWIVRAAISDGAGAAGEAIVVGEGRRAVVVARTGHPAPGGTGAFVALGDELTIGDDGVFAFRAVVGDGDAARDAAFRGRIGGAGRPALAPADAGEASLATDGLPEAESAPQEGAEVVEFALASLLVTPGGDWLARGTDGAGQEWVFRNGEPVALAGGPVTLAPREREVFGAGPGGPAFFSMSESAQGDLAIGGATESPAGARSAAVVLNAQRVLLRVGDPVDLDGNGAADDDAYIHAFAADGAALSDGGWYYFGATIRDGSGRVLGEGLLRAAVCKPDWDASGAADSADLGAFIAQWAVSISEGVPLADYNRDGVADTADVASFLAAWVEAVGGGC